MTAVGVVGIVVDGVGVANVVGVVGVIVFVWLCCCRIVVVLDANHSDTTQCIAECDKWLR